MLKKKKLKSLLLYPALISMFFSHFHIYINQPAASTWFTLSAMATASLSPLLPELQQAPAGRGSGSGSSGAWQSSGSIGPFCAVISVLALLSVLSCFLGRICSRRSEEITPLQSGNCLSFLKRKLQRPCVKDDEVGVKGMHLDDGAAMDANFNKDGNVQNPSF